jgi:hypothetical protein
MGRPVTEDREAGKNRRSAFLEKQPVADDVLDVVGHHGEHRCDKVNSKIPVMKRSYFSNLVLATLNRQSYLAGCLLVIPLNGFT